MAITLHQLQKHKTGPWHHGWSDMDNDMDNNNNEQSQTHDNNTTVNSPQIETCVRNIQNKKKYNNSSNQINQKSIDCMEKILAPKMMELAE